jgi:hypothetical protein
MSPYFSEQQIEQFHLDRRRINGEHAILQIFLTSRRYKTTRGQEYATHGFGRRLMVIQRAVNQVFAILPPGRVDIPERAVVTDATIAIQSCLMNVVGCLDNLAWLWVYENDIRGDGGKPLSRKFVGLWKTHKQLRSSLPTDFQQLLDSRVKWFDYIQDFRDSLAHRIPLYIPPFIVDPKISAEYDRLEQEANTAATGEQYDQARAEQQKLVVFRPWITHSVHEQSPFALLHPQLLIDFDTVNDLGRRMLAALGQSR